MRGRSRTDTCQLVYAGIWVLESFSLCSASPACFIPTCSCSSSCLAFQADVPTLSAFLKHLHVSPLFLFLGQKKNKKKNHKLWLIPINTQLWPFPDLDKDFTSPHWQDLADGCHQDLLVRLLWNTFLFQTFCLLSPLTGWSWMSSRTSCFTVRVTWPAELSYLHIFNSFPAVLLPVTLCLQG